MNKSKLLLKLLLILSLVLSVKTYAIPYPYCFCVDSFELKGPASYYFIDDFNNNGLTSPWLESQPTVTESNGVLKLSSPGDIIFKSFHGAHAIIESTTVGSTLMVGDGLGDSIATSTWLPKLPKKNQIFFMEAFHFLAPSVSESISIGISRFSPGINKILGFPASINNIPMLFFGWEDLSIGKVNFQAVPINSQAITGNIVLRIIFNDTTNQFNGGFSLNGGNTFQYPFNPVSPTTFNTPFFWAMNAASCDPTPEANTAIYFTSGLLLLIWISRRKNVKITH